MWLFTDNTDFVGGRTREQDPIVAAQFHLTYKFTRTMWLAGGRQLLHGRTDDDRRQAEPRPPAQLTDRRDVFDGARSPPGHSDVGEPRRLHDDRRRISPRSPSATTTRGPARDFGCSIMTLAQVLNGLSRDDLDDVPVHALRIRRGLLVLIVALACGDRRQGPRQRRPRDSPAAAAATPRPGTTRPSPRRPRRSTSYRRGAVPRRRARSPATSTGWSNAAPFVSA